jgi:hypothetical protein
MVKLRWLSSRVRLLARACARHAAQRQYTKNSTLRVVQDSEVCDLPLFGAHARFSRFVGCRFILISRTMTAIPVLCGLHCSSHGQGRRHVLCTCTNLTRPSTILGFGVQNCLRTGRSIRKYTPDLFTVQPSPTDVVVALRDRSRSANGQFSCVLGHSFEGQSL